MTPFGPLRQLYSSSRLYALLLHFLGTHPLSYKTAQPPALRTTSTYNLAPFSVPQPNCYQTRPLFIFVCVKRRLRRRTRRGNTLRHLLPSRCASASCTA
ncbi:unnamed protein product [Chondrus crispus]|uniref:Uncharacterized protein n=1 Tax=Chondrus crispus TaxID=2769 RepID=R7Q9H0_CHOCR|nr:unnamed protein product [Chondrus crispus]CDF34433.1 unnamed protein product [Chondrus crispus]|eukprot:XP_005714252.1 unnamed protein product [Chondrus crispus]